jgi:integrase/recombinase XerD
MGHDRLEIEVLPATTDPDAVGELVVHADLERLRREVAAPDIVRKAGPGAEYAYADFFKAKISNSNTRKAYKRAVDRFLGWCQWRGLELRQLTSFLVGDYVEHHLVDKEGQPLSPPTKKQHLAALRHFFDNQQMYHGVGINPASSVRGPKYSAREGKTPAFNDRQVRTLIDSIDTSDVVGVRDKTLLMVLAYTPPGSVPSPGSGPWTTRPTAGRGPSTSGRKAGSSTRSPFDTTSNSRWNAISGTPASRGGPTRRRCSGPRRRERRSGR